MLRSHSGCRSPFPAVGVLRPDDLLVVLTELHAVCSKWYYIGLALGLTADTLDAMKGPHKEHVDCLTDMVKKWLNTSPDPSWQSLIQALRSPIVGKEPLARHLENKFCTRGGSVPPEGKYKDAISGTCTLGIAICEWLQVHIMSEVQPIQTVIHCIVSVSNSNRSD